MRRFVKNQREGWAIYAGGQSGIIDKTKSWHFYISVKPTKENLEKAQIALNKLIVTDDIWGHSQHPTIKVALPEDPNQSLHYFDATMPPPAKHMPVPDHDLMGREISVSMDYDSVKRRFTFDTETYKASMLKMWHALEEANVELNYITPDIDEFEINCDDEILAPFSYSAYKNEDERHGLLYSNNPNPNNIDDPLSGLRITKQDKAKYNIEGGCAQAVCYKRITYQEERLTKANLRMLGDEEKNMQGDRHAFFNAAENPINCQTVLQSITKLLAISEDKAFINAGTEFLLKQDEWKYHLPFLNLRPVFEDNQVNEICAINEDLQLKFKLMRELLMQIKTRSEQEIECIIKDMVTEKTPNPEKFKKAIRNNPAIAQGIYRRIVHLGNANNRHKREQIRLLEDCVFQESYSTCWNEKDGTLYTKAKHLLDDYTKGGSTFKLFLYGHANRDPTQIKEVQRILHDPKIKDLEELMKSLNCISLKDSGSLGARVAFILRKSYEEQKKEEAKLNYKKYS